MHDPQALRETPLTDWHRTHGAKMVEFAGFSMPVQYQTGVLSEHAAVRQKVGLFDITHMGEIYVTGKGAGGWLDGLVTNNLVGIPLGKVVYCAMCNEQGGVLDDMLVYRLGEERWLVVCNAANHDKVVSWLEERLPAKDVTLDDASFRTALIAVQGPDSRNLVTRLATLQSHADAICRLNFYSGLTVTAGGAEWLVSRTGYTGEHGYEIYLPNAAALSLWEELLDRGEELGVVPMGLAARDTLRFEVCYSLYGHELTEEVTPLEAGIGWAVKFKKGDYIGKDVLQQQKAAGVPRRLVGLAVQGRTIARQGATLYARGREVGRITSGTFSPTLKRPLALALVASGYLADDLQVEVRSKSFPCRAVPIPFLFARVKGDPRAERNLPA